ncbi:MAG: glycosyltransferase family 4 protein [Thermoanaerobaculia bacterium]
MRILCVATKIPWPPADGGRLLLYNTLRALASAGHRLTLVAPTLGDGVAAATEELRPFCRLQPVKARLRPRLADAARAQVRRRPWTVVRHRLPAVRRRVAELLHGETFDLIHAEQVQALGSIAGLDNGPPVVWRAQNVESDLWRAMSRQASWRRPLFELEARRLARWEGEAVRRAAATVALTAEDAARLATLSGEADKIHRVAAPFAAELPSADRDLPGSPAVVLLGSGGWLPNRRGTGWFLDQVWPRVDAALDGAVLHLFGTDLAADRPTVRVHPPPADSREAFPPGAILVVPLAIASGVRMKILEAWARGVPVVATPAAARGLGAEPGRELAVAETAEDFVKAIREIGEEPELAASRTAAGRDLLRREHAFDRVAVRLAEVYTATGASTWRPG